MKETEPYPLQRSRMILIFAILLSILLFLALSLAVSVIVLDTHQSFEIDDMQGRMERFADMVNLSVKSLSRTAEDYAVWDDTAEYIKGKKPDYIETETSPESFLNIDIHLVGFFDEDGNLLFLRDYSRDEPDNEKIREEFVPYLNPDSPLINSKNRSSSVNEMVFNTGTRSGLLVSRPVSYHTHDEKTGGTIIMGRYFTDTLCDELSLMLKKPFAIPEEARGEAAFSERSGPSDIRVQVYNESIIQAFLRIQDPISGKNTYFLVEYPRDIYHQGQSALFSYLIVIALIIVVFTVLIFLGLSYYFKHAKAMQAHARLSDTTYRQIIQDIEDAYFRADPDGIITSISPSSVRMLGYSSEDELVGVPIRSLFQNPDDRDTIRSILFQKGEVRTHPVILKRNDGSLAYVSVNVHLTYSEEGTVTGMEGIAHDNTESIVARKTSVQEESIYRLVFDSANIGLFQSSPDGKFISVNPAFAFMLGYESPEQMKQEISDISTELYYDPAERRRIMELLENDGSIENEEVLLKKGDGCLIWVNLNVVVIRDMDDESIAFFGTAIDITEKKSIEKDLMESQQKFHSLFYLSPIAIMVYDADGVLIDANSAAISLFGAEDQGILEAETLFHHPYFSEKEQHLIEDRQEVDTEVVIDYDQLRSRYHLPPSQKGKGYLHIRVTPIPHPFKRETGWFLTQISDITEKKEAEMERSISEMKYRQVFTNVSHGLILFSLDHDGKPGRILDLNPKAEDLLQKPLSEILSSGDGIRRHLPISEYEMSQAINGDTVPFYTFESAIIRGNTPVLINVTLSVFHLMDKKVGLTIIEDITAKKLQEEERMDMIHQIEKNLAELAILNDGIRNPLTIIMMMVDELDEKISKPVLAQVRSIDELINQLDRRWVESDKILRFLQKHHHIMFQNEMQDSR